MMYFEYGFGSMYVLWVFYLAVMNLKRAQEAGTLTKPALVLGMPVLVIGYAIDILVNVVVASVLFLELPHYQRLTLSARLGYHLRNSSNWRYKLSLWIVRNLLDSFDPSGKHVGV